MAVYNRRNRRADGARAMDDGDGPRAGRDTAPPSGGAVKVVLDAGVSPGR